MGSGRIHTFLSRDYPGQIAPPTWHVYDIEPTDKYVWFACLNPGIVRYDKQNNTWSNPLEDINHKVLRQEGEVKPSDFMRGIDNMAVFNNRLWFTHPKLTNPKASELQKIGYTLEDRSIFSCDLSGEDFQSLSLADGLPKAEISSVQATEDNLFLGTSGRQAVGSYIVSGPYGLLIMSKDGDFEIFEATEIFNRKPRSVGLKQIVVLENEVWAAVGDKLKVLKYK